MRSGTGLCTNRAGSDGVSRASLAGHRIVRPGIWSGVEFRLPSRGNITGVSFLGSRSAGGIAPDHGDE